MLTQTTEQVETGSREHVESTHTQDDPPEPLSVLVQVNSEDHLLDVLDPLLDDHDGQSDVGAIYDSEYLLYEDHND